MPLCQEDATRLENQATESFTDAVLDRKVCLVSDVWIFPKDATQVCVDELPFQAMQVILTGQPWTTQSITQYYDCSDLDPRLRGMLLSRRSFSRDSSGRIHVWISTVALKYLRATDLRLTKDPDAAPKCKPPKFAIADSFVAGSYRELDQATIIERQAVSLAQIRGVVKVIYGGPGNTLNSHLLCWDNRDATIASQLPNIVGRETFQLILAGPMTKAQEVPLAKRHECNIDRVQQAH
jgi:hypothetical protein